MRPRPLIVELVGPAGAGKTAVLRAIRAHDPQILTGLSIDRLRFSVELARQAVALAPTGIELLWKDPQSWWSTAVHLLRLRTFPSVLRHEARAARRAIIMDEGPLFSLGHLDVFQDASRAGGRVAREWRAALERYVALLDGVVWLDAPDHVLMRRIRDRPKAHRIKAGTDDEMLRFLAQYRRAYRELLDSVWSAGRAMAVECDTASASAEAVAITVLKELGLMQPVPESPGGP